MGKSKLFVIGLYGMTSFLSVDSFPQEGETKKSGRSFYEVGGKGYNQAFAAKKLGADVCFFTALGNDFYTPSLEKQLEQEKFHFFKYEKKHNDFACVVTDATGENFVLLNDGVSSAVGKNEIDAIREHIATSEGVLVQNELSFEATYEVLKIAHQKDKLTIFDPAPISKELKESPEIFDFCDVVTPNWGEAVDLIHGTTDMSPLEVAKKIQALGAKNVILTMGKQGSFVLTETGEYFQQPIFNTTPVDTTGAGDIFSAALGVALCEGSSMKEAVIFATAASGLSVTKKGVFSAIPLRKDIQRLIEASSQD